MQTNNLILGVVAFVLFIVSGFLITRGVLDYYQNRDFKNNDEVATRKNEKGDDEVELSGYFEGYYESDGDLDSYALDDPFREVCSQVEGEEGTTVVLSNIVCYK